MTWIWNGKINFVEFLFYLDSDDSKGYEMKRKQRVGIFLSKRKKNGTKNFRSIV